MAATQKYIRLSDYYPYAYNILSINLDIQLDPLATVVTANLQLNPNFAYHLNCFDIILDGEDLELLDLQLNGKKLIQNTNFKIENNKLHIFSAKQQPHQLLIKTKCVPRHNLKLSGLYESANNLVTQCEAEGFRRITYYPDRPDVLSYFTVKLTANQFQYPTLLSNGNKIACGNNLDGTHWVSWSDPFLKPSYLFAVVAGQFGSIHSIYTNRLGKIINLSVYAKHEQLHQCQYAMDSLLAAIQWDEQTYGCVCDLDHYAIVAVDDFNSGAMENKGLNIFNSKYLLADPETATDEDYKNILAVVGHEYFHNWSGNRVTCRDWFQLSLKEGFTIFREQQFMADQFAADLCRIEDIKRMRSEQFAQDSSSMAHPVQPDEYIEIRNFYTVTIYEKGAELIRMLQQILGAEGFINGAQKYFQKYDGQAATINDLITTIAEVNSFDATQFFQWYKYAGTPEVTITKSYDANKNQLSLTVHQRCSNNPNQSESPVFYIPLAISLIDPHGEFINCHCEESLPSSSNTQAILPIDKEQQTFVFTKVFYDPVLSLFRGFSAPVKYFYDFSPNDLMHITKYDTDLVSRWDAVQNLFSLYFCHRIDTDMISKLFADLLADAVNDPGTVANLIMFPQEQYIYSMNPKLMLDDLFMLYDQLKLKLAEDLQYLFIDIYQKLNQQRKYEPSPDHIQQRLLKNVCLSYLSAMPSHRELIYQQYIEASNLTDRLAALSQLNNTDDSLRKNALDDFAIRYQSNQLVLDKWYALYATANIDQTLTNLKRVMEHNFNWHNPNRLYATVGRFSRTNLRAFHAVDGSGYEFLVDALTKIDQFNPEVAARLAEPFTRYHQLDEPRKVRLSHLIKQMLSENQLSKELLEIIKS